MTVDTKRVTRRGVTFKSYDDVLADAERLAGNDAKTTGNWTLGQIFEHLAKSIHSSIDGTDMQFPWLMKKIFSLVMNKEKMLTRPIPPGYKIPKKGQAQFAPDPSVSTEDGLRQLREAIDSNDAERAQKLLPGTMAFVDVMVKKGVLHENAGNRYKSRLSRRIAALSAS